MARSSKKLSAEELAEQRAKNLAKGRETRAANLKIQIDARIWPYVERKMSLHNCKCELLPGKTLEELVSLGGGCTMPDFACPALSTYRRLLERPEEA